MGISDFRQKFELHHSCSHLVKQFLSDTNPIIIAIYRYDQQTSILKVCMSNINVLV